MGSRRKGSGSSTDPNKNEAPTIDASTITLQPGQIAGQPGPTLGNVPTGAEGAGGGQATATRDGPGSNPTLPTGTGSDSKPPGASPTGAPITGDESG